MYTLSGREYEEGGSDASKTPRSAWKILSTVGVSHPPGLAPFEKCNMSVSLISLPLPAELELKAAFVQARFIRPILDRLGFWRMGLLGHTFA
jgi:hypothetical protein